MDKGVEIACNQTNMEPDYSGGILSVNAADIKVFDENNIEITIDQLTTLAEKYWDTYYL